MYSGVKTPKRRVNVSIDSVAMDEARSRGLNLSELLERSLVDELKRLREAEWQVEHAEAIDRYNAHVSEHGRVSTKLRRMARKS